MSMTPNIDQLIERLAPIIQKSKSESDFYAARLYQRDLILLLMQSPRTTPNQIASAYFELAEFCAMVGDYKGVNKFTARAVKYRKMLQSESAFSRMFTHPTILAQG